MIFVRNPETIYQARGTIENGTFRGRWHFSFDEYDDPDNRQFGTLRVFNDDTLSPGAVWPLHPHREIEVVTYCAAGEFRHADEHGKGGVLKKGWVQHTTVGRGMFHSEINNRSDLAMRFVQMWFLPERQELEPSVEQKRVERKDRTNRFFPLVSKAHSGALPIRSDARVFSSFLDGKSMLDHFIESGRGVYFYVLEGGPVEVSGHRVPPLGAAKITGESKIEISAQEKAELLLLDVKLI